MQADQNFLDLLLASSTNSSHEVPDGINILMLRKLWRRANKELEELGVPERFLSFSGDSQKVTILAERPTTVQTPDSVLRALAIIKEGKSITVETLNDFRSLEYYASQHGIKLSRKRVKGQYRISRFVKKEIKWKVS